MPSKRKGLGLLREELIFAAIRWSNCAGDGCAKCVPALKKAVTALKAAEKLATPKREES